MSETHDAQPSSLPPDVASQAQAEAERFFGDGPVASWQPPAASGKPGWWRRTVWLAAAGCIAVAAGIGAVAGAGGWTGADEAQPQPPVASDPADDIVDEPPMQQPVTARAGEAAPRLLSSPTLSITRRGAEWRIEAVGVSRLAAAQRLAQASGSPLLGNTATLAGARPLDLRWQGRNAAGAWRAVLGPEVNFAMQCGAARCRVWIIETGAQEQASPTMLRVPAVASPPPWAIDVAAAPSASDSADPRVAAHHD